MHNLAQEGSEGDFTALSTLAMAAATGALSSARKCRRKHYFQMEVVEVILKLWVEIHSLALAVRRNFLGQG
jgi:hypothetical protein